MFQIIRDLIIQVKELINDLLAEINRQYHDNISLRDPFHRLDDELKMMFGRGEISQEKYAQIKSKLYQGQIGRGDLQLLHRDALQKPSGASYSAQFPLDPEIQKSLNRLYLDRARLEDGRMEAEKLLDSLDAGLKQVRDRAEHAREKARSTLPDEHAARVYLEAHQIYLERAHILEERLYSLRDSLRRIEVLRNQLEAYEAELMILGSEQQLVGLETSIRESLLIHR